MIEQVEALPLCDWEGSSVSGLNHTFILLENSGDRRHQYKRHLNDATALSLDDALVSYFLDTFAWVQTENPAKRNSPSSGLNRYGPTAISGESAVKFRKILEGWISLIQNAPSEFALTGEYFKVEGVESSGEYHRIHIVRDKLLGTLRGIAQLSERAAKPGYWLLHVGV